MTYQEVLTAARGCIGPYCKACPVCNGKACGNAVPGPGAKGSGTAAVRNYEAWQKLHFNMDTICDNAPVDTSYEFFRQRRGWRTSPQRTHSWCPRGRCHRWCPC